MKNWNPWEGLQDRQQKREARLAWLRGLEEGAVVALTVGGAGCEKTTERVKVTKVTLTGFDVSDRNVFVEGHSRRPLRLGKWERGGRDWLWLRIDPVGEPEGQR